MEIGSSRTRRAIVRGWKATRPTCNLEYKPDPSGRRVAVPPQYSSYPVAAANPPGMSSSMLLFSSTKNPEKIGREARPLRRVDFQTTNFGSVQDALPPNPDLELFKIYPKSTVQKQAHIITFPRGTGQSNIDFLDLKQTPMPACGSTMRLRSGKLRPIVPGAISPWRPCLARTHLGPVNDLALATAPVFNGNRLNYIKKF